MRAWQVVRNAEPAEALALAEAAEPRPGPGQLLVRMRAAAANFPDVLLCRGTYQARPELPFTLGAEGVGEVVAVGEGVDPSRVGERVCGMGVLPNGTFAQLTLMPAIATFPAPPELNDVEAAGFHVSYFTGWFGLHRRAGLQAGETLLVLAAAGGVGLAAVQLGKEAGARVIAVAGSPEKAAVAAAAGADLVIDRTSADVVATVKDATGGRGADVVFDPVGGPAFEQATRVVAFEGRILVVGFAGGVIQQAPMAHALVKNYSLVGLHYGLYEVRAPELLPEADRALRAGTASGALRPVVGRVWEFEEVPEGLTQLAAGQVIGRGAFRVS